MANPLPASFRAGRAQWVFENNRRMGGAAGEAFTNTLASSGMPPAAVLAREAIQNSVDARATQERKVAVDFVAKSLSGSAKAAFVEAAGLAAIDARAAELGFKQPNCLAGLAHPSVPLDLLFVDDFKTTGLAGDPSKPDSKFYRFLLSLGDGGKEHEEHGTGGSYGFGKSVYSASSGILTIFAYSRTIDDKREPLSLLFGCGYYRKHKHADGYFTGRAWFGCDVTGGGEQVVEPLRGSQADALAGLLGFTPRIESELGTSVLIIDALVETDGILRGVEDWWWPRLISNRLDVRVIDRSGEVAFPRPRKRDDLRPFLDTFELATGKSPDNNKTDFRKPFNKIGDTGIGAAGFKVLARGDDNEFAVDEARVDAVALIRSTSMVVDYYRKWNVGTPAMAGAFVASEDIDDVLRAAEPPTHDRWDPEARRLQDPEKRNKQIVERVLKNIRRNLKQCQDVASPPPPPRPKRLTLLERALASFLAPSKLGSKDGVKPSSAPIHLTYDEEPRAETVAGGLRLVATFSVRLKGDEDIDSLEARVRVRCPVIEDGQDGESIAITINPSDPVDDDPSGEGWMRVKLAAHHSVKFECVSDGYDPLWTVRFVPEVEAVQAP